MLAPVEFIEAPFFTQVLPAYLGADDHRELQLHLARDPEAGNVIPGDRRVPKTSMAGPASGKGKRGGLRVIYYLLASDPQVWLMTVYDKDEAADLSPVERRALEDALDEELRQRAVLRRAREN